MYFFFCSSYSTGMKRKRADWDDDDDDSSAPTAKRMRFGAYEQRMFGVLQRLKSPVMAAGRGNAYSSYGGGASQEAREAFRHYARHVKAGMEEAKTFLKYYSVDR